MRPRRRAPSLCDITLLTPLFFFVCNKTFYKRNGKQNINASTAIITTTAVLLVQLLLHVQQHFFTYLFFPLTCFWSESGNFYGIINSKGWGGGGAEHLLHGIFCTFSWIALCFLDVKRFWTVKECECRTCLRRSVTHKDLKRRLLRLLQRISEDRKTMQKHSGLLLHFIIF